MIVTYGANGSWFRRVPSIGNEPKLVIGNETEERFEIQECFALGERQNKEGK